LYRVELTGGASVLVSSPHRINPGVETEVSWSGTAGVLLGE
jgi:hypothetical protein